MTEGAVLTPPPPPARAGYSDSPAVSLSLVHAVFPWVAISLLSIQDNELRARGSLGGG